MSWLWGRALLADYLVAIVEAPAGMGRQPDICSAVNPTQHRVSCHGVVLCQASLLLRSLVELLEEDIAQGTQGGSVGAQGEENK